MSTASSCSRLASRPLGLRALVPLAAVVLFAGAGCAAKREAPPSSRALDSASGPVAQAAVAAGGATAAAGADAKPLAAGRALVVTVEMTLTARNPDAVALRLRDEAARAGGFVADASAQGSAGSPESRSARVVLRVPADRTRSLRALVADLGTITSDTEKSEDVTEQRADLDARLGNARAQEKRLVEIMAHKTGSVGEVLEVERELARVRESVERLDAQKRGLDGKIDLATVTVSVQSTYVPTAAKEEGALARIAGAFRAGLTATGALALYAAMAFAAASPVLVPLGVLAALVVVVTRRRRRAQLAAMAAVRGTPEVREVAA
jgi:hypothetical protein